MLTGVTLERLLTVANALVTTDKRDLWEKLLLEIVVVELICFEIFTYVGLLLREKRSALGKENICFEGEVFMGLVLA